MTSRQAEWQRKKRREKKCQICGKPEEVAGYCSDHRDKRLARLREHTAPGRQKRCSICSAEGHNKRSCPVRRG